MKTSLKLRNRFIGVCVLLTCITSLFFVLVVLESIHSIERDLFGQLLKEQAEWLIHLDQHERLNSFELSNQWQLYKTDKGDESKLPLELENLAPGFHEIVGDTADFHVYVDQVEEQKYILSFDQTLFENRERDIILFLILLFLTVLALGAFAGMFLFSIAMKPVTSLADQVEAIDPSLPEKKLASYYADDVVGRLATVFDKQIASIRYFLLQEKLFTGDVSHELRTPLTVISGAVDVLSKHKQDSDKSTQAMQRIKKATREMSELVNAFLLLSAVKEDRNYKHPLVVVNQIAAAQLIAIQENVIERDIQTVFDEQTFLQVNAEPKLLATVFRNLLQNAARDIKDSGTISVTIKDNYVTIEDNGRGIPEDIIESVFHQSERIAPDKAKGHGFGLAIVKRICDSNQWKITVKSDTSGTAFTIAFPQQANSVT